MVGKWEFYMYKWYLSFEIFMPIWFTYNNEYLLFHHIQSPCPCGSPLLTPYLHRRGSNKVLSQSLWGLWVLVCTRFVWALWVSLVGKRFNSKHCFTSLAVLLGLLLCPWTWGIFFWWIQHSPVDCCSAASCSFGVLAGEDECMFFYSTISSGRWSSPLCLIISSGRWIISSVINAKK